MVLVHNKNKNTLVGVLRALEPPQTRVKKQETRNKTV